MQKQRHGSRWNWLGGIIAAFALSQAAAGSATAAERIFVNYSIFGRSLSIRALENYARTGQLSDELISYSRFVPKRQLAQLREGLLQKVNLSPVSVSQFLYSPTGEILLSRLSQIIQTPQGQGSFYALRSALILSAADPGGMTPLSILRYYPSPDLVVNVEDIVRVVNEVNWLLGQTASVTRQIQTLSAGTPLQPPASSQLLALKRPGPLKWEKYTLTLHDDSPKRLRYTRHVRTLIADAYVPQTDQPQPVVVISHGLNSDRQSYAYLAQHLASYGFMVAVPEHPGSNKQQVQALLEGIGRDVAEPVEFLDRPLDVQFLLSALQNLAQSDERFRGRLDTTRAGIIGQSFGGYTSLAAAGAPLDFVSLRQKCSRQLNTTLNFSLVLQCQALRQPSAQYQLADPRIKAAIAINPITSALFSPASLAQLQVPVMIVSGSDDVVAPALSEQIEPFTHLTTSQRYLALIQNSNHFSTIAPAPVDEPSPIPQLQGLEGPAPDLARTYIKVLSLVFMDVYLKGESSLKGYLSPAGAATLSQPPLPLSLSTVLPEKGLIPTNSPR